MKLIALMNIGSNGQVEIAEGEPFEREGEAAERLIRLGAAKAAGSQAEGATPPEPTAKELIATLEADPSQAEAIGTAEVQRADPRKSVLQAVDAAKAKLAGE